MYGIDTDITQIFRHKLINEENFAQDRNILPTPACLTFTCMYFKICTMYTSAGVACMHASCTRELTAHMAGFIKMYRICYTGRHFYLDFLETFVLWKLVNFEVIFVFVTTNNYSRYTMLFLLKYYFILPR